MAINACTEQQFKNNNKNEENLIPKLTILPQLIVWMSKNSSSQQKWEHDQRPCHLKWCNSVGYYSIQFDHRQAYRFIVFIWNAFICVCVLYTQTHAQWTSTQFQINAFVTLNIIFHSHSNMSCVANRKKPFSLSLSISFSATLLVACSCMSARIKKWRAWGIVLH